MNQLVNIFEKAMAALNAGRLADAEAQFRTFLKSQPNNVGALNLLTVTLMAMGRFSDAEPLIGKAVGLDSTSAKSFLNYGIILKNLNRPAEALEKLTIAQRINPRDPETWMTRGALHARLGSIDDALRDYDTAIALRPTHAAAYHGKGNVLSDAGRFDEALAAYDRALACDRTLAEAWIGRGIALSGLKRFDDALSAYDKALALKPKLTEAWIGRGKSLADLQRFDEAIACFEKAIAINPHLAGAHQHLGTALAHEQRLEEALACYEKAIALDPGLADAHFNAGYTLLELNRPGAAVPHFEQAIALDPEHVGAHHDLGHALLVLGDFARGQVEFEYRKLVASAVSRDFKTEDKTEEWTGQQDISGKTLFIYPELYLGDLIQFGRYAKLAEARGARVIFGASSSMHRLLATISPTIKFVAKDEEPNDYDFRCALMSLPYAFRTRLDTIPADMPYLRAEPERIAAWRQRIGSEGFKIGICWQGSTLSYAVAMRRSFPVALFEEVAKLPGVRLISLQRDDGTEQLSDLPEGMTVETLGSGYDAGPHAFLDAAAVIASLDLVISTDTAMAHLAGALGCPTWVAIKDAPDWRWQLGRQDSPWYPGMRLFRQKSRGDWKNVFVEIEDALRDRLAEAAAGGE